MGEVVATMCEDELVGLPELPSFVFTEDGQRIDTADLIWKPQYAGWANIIDWHTLGGANNQPVFTARALYYIKLYIAYYLQRSLSNVKRHFQCIYAFSQWYQKEWYDTSRQSVNSHYGWDALNSQIVDAYADYCISNARQLNFEILRRFYEWGVRNNLPDFDRNVLLHLWLRYKCRGKMSHDLIRSSAKGVGLDVPDLPEYIQLESGDRVEISDDIWVWFASQENVSIHTISWAYISEINVGEYFLNKPII